MVDEDAAAGASVGRVAGSAPDTADVLTDWRIVSGNSRGAFAIDPATGEIRVAAAAQLDHETTGSFVLGIQVSDGSRTSTPETVTITIADVNEAPTALVLSNTTIADGTDTSGGQLLAASSSHHDWSPILPETPGINAVTTMK